jgi:hypothetical protein
VGKPGFWSTGNPGINPGRNSAWRNCGAVVGLIETLLPGRAGPAYRQLAAGVHIAEQHISHGDWSVLAAMA